MAHIKTQQQQDDQTARIAGYTAGIEAGFLRKAGAGDELVKTYVADRAAKVKSTAVFLDSARKGFKDDESIAAYDLPEYAAAKARLLRVLGK